MLTFEIFSLDDNYQEVVIIQWYCSYHPVLSFDVWLHWNRTHHITPLVINKLGGGHTGTHTHTRIPTHGPKQFQETRCTQPKAASAWFKNLFKMPIIHILKVNIQNLKCITLQHFVCLTACLLSCHKTRFHYGYRALVFAHNKGNRFRFMKLLFQRMFIHCTMVFPFSFIS